MKKTFNILTGVLLTVFLVTASLTVAACKQNPEDKTKKESEKNDEESEGLIIPIKEVYFWTEDAGSFDAASGKIILKNGSKGASIGIDAVDASEYKYVKLVYEKLDFPNIIFRVHYEDESLSEVFLQKKM